MDMDRDRAGLELKVRLRERTRNCGRVPAKIQSAIRYRIAVGKNLGRIFEDERNANFLKLVASGRQPVIALCEPGA